MSKRIGLTLTGVLTGILVVLHNGILEPSAPHAGAALFAWLTAAVVVAAVTVFVYSVGHLLCDLWVIVARAAPWIPGKG